MTAVRALPLEQRTTFDAGTAAVLLFEPEVVPWFGETTSRWVLRGFGLPQHPPGVHPTLDAAKVAAFRAAATAVESLRRNEPMHRFVHRIVKGREGNDGYRGGKKPQSANAS